MYLQLVRVNNVGRRGEKKAVPATQGGVGTDPLHRNLGPTHSPAPAPSLLQLPHSNTQASAHQLCLTQIVERGISLRSLILRTVGAGRTLNISLCGCRTAQGWTSQLCFSFSKTFAPPPGSK